MSHTKLKVLEDGCLSLQVLIIPLTLSFGKILIGRIVSFITCDVEIDCISLAGPVTTCQSEIACRNIEILMLHSGKVARVHLGIGSSFSADEILKVLST